MVKFPKVLGILSLGLLSLATAHAEMTVQGAPTRRIVAFKPETPIAQRLSIAQETGGTIVRELPFINAVVVEMPAARIRIAEARLKTNENVSRVDEDPKINWLNAGATFADVNLSEMLRAIKPLKHPKVNAPAPTGQEVPWGIKRVNAAGAWPTTRGKGVKVVVIDTGVDYNHPDLKANIAGGWNAITKGSDFMDDHGHGSHCAGTIAALDNDIGVVGVAPEASVYGVKVLDANGSGTFDDVIAGMQWAVDNHMQVASMSLGASQGNDSLAAAVDAMVKGGVTLIAAAGNSGPGDNTVGYPAGYPGAIAIAASDVNDAVASFSSRGPQVAVIAPGVGVKSTTGGSYGTMSGTSMATPHVSGLAVLAIAAKGYTNSEQVRAALKAAATPFPNVPAEHQGAGLPDAAKLVK